MPDPANLNQYNDINQAIAEQIQNILLKVMDPANEIDPKSLDSKIFQTLISQGVRASGDIQALIAKGVISEEEGKRRHEELKETLSLKTENELKKIRAKGAEKRAEIIAAGGVKETLTAQALDAKKEIKAGEAALKREMPLISAEAKAIDYGAKTDAALRLREHGPVADARAKREALRVEQAPALKVAEDNYGIQKKRLIRAIKAGEPLPEIPAAALSVMEPGGFKAKLETFRDGIIADRRVRWEKDKVVLGLNDPVAIQPIESVVAAGGDHKPLVEKALKVQKAVVSATDEFLKQGVDVAPGGTKVSLLNQPLWGGGAKTEAATEGVKKVLSLISQTGEFNPASVNSVAQAVKSAGKLGGLTKAGIGGAGMYLLYKLLAGGEKAPEMTPQQQLMLAQQLQEQQQKAALVQSLIQQREASAENDMAKAMLLKMQMMQGAGGGGGGVL